MKIAVVTLMVLLPLAFAAPEKRFIFDSFQALLNAVNLDTFKQDIQTMVDAVGSDPAEQVCENECHKIAAGLLDNACPLVCHSFQEAVSHFHIVPDVTTTMSM